jgi:hypothetical protein
VLEPTTTTKRESQVGIVSPNNNEASKKNRNRLGYCFAGGGNDSMTYYDIAEQISKTRSQT